MLTGLRIEGYALIDALEVEWQPGLTALTGETGSGKSIVLGALGLVLGERADSNVIREGAQKCIVEAVFSSDQSEWLTSHELDVLDELCIRREISAKGRSRAFVNDTPVAVADLRSLGARLVDLHGQENTLALAEKPHRIALIDALGVPEQVLQGYKEAFSDWRKKLAERHELLASEGQASSDPDYLQYQITEIEGLQLDQHDASLREAEWNTLQHAGQIRTELLEAHAALLSDDRETDALTLLGQAVKSLARASAHHPQAEALVERLEGVRMEALEIAHELTDEADRIQEDPEREHLLGQWLDELQRLLTKHRLNSAEELLELCATMSRQLAALNQRKIRITEIDEEIEIALRSVMERGITLRTVRKRVASGLAASILAHLGGLKMAQAELEIRWTPATEPDAWGLDDVEWYFRSHPTSSFQPLTQVASGGEKSRLMLAIKAVQSKHSLAQTIILDEIDTGVSGHVAECMAQLMEAMAAHQQVIAVTHLPQVAGRADHHLRVSKLEGVHHVATQVTQLSREERVQEIASMLSGAKVTQAATEHAKALMKPA